MNNIQRETIQQVIIRDRVLLQACNERIKLSKKVLKDEEDIKKELETKITELLKDLMPNPEGKNNG